MKKIISISVLTLSLSLLNGCSVMRSVGGSLTDYGEKNDGIIGDLAGATGAVYSAVGCEGVAKDDKECEKKE